MGENIEHTSMSKLMTIHSKDRQTLSMTSSNFLIDLGTSTKVNQVKRVTIRRVKIPNTEYNINSKNNKLNVESTLNGTLNLTIPIGQYTTAELLTEIKTLYDAANAPSVITFIQNSKTGIISWSISSDTIYFDSASILAPYLGIKTTVAASAGATFDMPPNLYGLTSVKILSNEIANCNSVTSKQEYSNILCVVPIKVAYGQYDHYEPQDHELSAIKYKVPKDLRYIDIIILDENDKQVNFNGFDIEIQLKMWY